MNASYVGQVCNLRAKRCIYLAVALRADPPAFALSSAPKRCHGTDTSIRGKPWMLTPETMMHRLRWLALDESLKWLGNLDPRQSRIVELRFFGGPTVAEAA